MDPAQQGAQLAARERLVRALLRETDVATRRAPGLLELDLPAGTMTVGLRTWSPSGHHVLGDEAALAGRAIGHRDAVDALLGASGAGHLAPLVAESVARTARYLRQPAPQARTTREAEQALRLGHPFHPTPKSAEGLTDDDLAAWAPELGAEFALYLLAVDPALVVSGGAPGGDAGVLPVHPYQARVLSSDPTLRLLEAEGVVRWLGAVGPRVWPTSSVRTVVDPATGASWKLPLRARLTHFVRTTPPEQAQRAIDASAVVDRLGALPPGFGVIPDVGYRTLDPATVGEHLAADLTVVDRAPFPSGEPRVLASLLEGDDPPLLADVRAAGDVHAWLRRWLAVSLAPMLAIYDRHGIGFEAHPQNTLVVTDRAGWPVTCLVRDLEGAHVRADRVPAGLDPSSPLVYSADEAWLRLRYHVVVNQLGLLVAVLGRHTVGEEALWATAAAALAEIDGPHARDLRSSPTLPAKAHLRSWAGGHGERPSYVAIPNPLVQSSRTRTPFT